MKTPPYWSKRGPEGAMLLPLSLVYGALARLHRNLRKPQRAPLPVVSVGNVTAGGAGKTPSVIALVEVLRDIGHRPHILTRGYGGEKLVAHRASPDDDWKKTGDEALLLAQIAPTWVGADRIESAKAALAEGATVVICDDALQHHRLHKDVSLLIVDGPFGIGNGWLLPSGPLREPFADAAARCHGTIVIGPDAQGLSPRLPAPVFAASLEVAHGPKDIAEGKWVAFAGIGRPSKFYDSLRAQGANIVETHDFPDHHPYNDVQIKALKKRAAKKDAKLITTVKDLVRIAPAERKDIERLPVVLKLADSQGLKALLKAKLPASA